LKVSIFICPTNAIQNAIIASHGETNKPKKSIHHGKSEEPSNRSIDEIYGEPEEKKP
jgi:hypothetical protein